MEKSNLLQNYNSINSDVDAASIYFVLELVHKEEHTEHGGGLHTLCSFPAMTLSKWQPPWFQFLQI